MPWAIRNAEILFVTIEHDAEIRFDIDIDIDIDIAFGIDVGFGMDILVIFIEMTILTLMLMMRLIQW